MRCTENERVIIRKIFFRPYILTLPVIYQVRRKYSYTCITRLNTKWQRKIRKKWSSAYVHPAPERCTAFRAIGSSARIPIRSSRNPAHIAAPAWGTIFWYPDGQVCENAGRSRFAHWKVGLKMNNMIAAKRNRSSGGVAICRI